MKNKSYIIYSKIKKKNENNLFSFSTLFFEVGMSDGKINKKRKYFHEIYGFCEKNI